MYVLTYSKLAFKTRTRHYLNGIANSRNNFSFAMEIDVTLLS